MTIIDNEHGQRVLIPSDGKWLLAVDELELPEEERYYTQAVYIASVLTLADCERMYVETEKPKEEQGVE
ncbi:MAG: hypothetical protein ACLRFN_02420 [Alphaproteobacteria bacterium]